MSSRSPRWTRAEARRLMGPEFGDAFYAEQQARRRGPPPVKAVGTVDLSRRVLGLDLALTTGWAVIVNGQLEATGVFRLPSEPRVRETRADFLLRRRDTLRARLRELFDSDRPDVVAYEYPDMARPSWSGGSKGREQTVAGALGILEGFLLTVLEEYAIDVIAVPARLVRLVASGTVGAPKWRVRLDIQTRIGRDLSVLTEDEVDAIAVALAVITPPTREGTS